MKRNLVLAALVMAGISAHAETAGFKTAAQAVAACKSMVDQFEHTQAAGGEISDAVRAELKSMTDMCNEQVRAVYKAIRSLNEEYIVGGVAGFGGFEFNTPKITRGSGNVSGIGGGAVFAVYDYATGTPGLRLVPLLGGTLGGSFVGSSPQLLEYQKGIIIFFARGSKNINDYNGTYVGGGFETRTPGANEISARSSSAVSVYANGTAYAAVIMRSTNTNPSTALGVKALGISMNTETGAGLSLFDIPAYYAGEIAKIYGRLSDGLFSAMK